MSVFDEAAETLRSLLPDEYADVRVRSRPYGMKVWFGPAQPPRHHYEAQVIAADAVAEADVLAIEVGFHLEDRKVERNDEVLAALVSDEEAWRRSLGSEPVAGPFLGRPDDWRRLSEVWPDPDLSEADLGFELGARMADYVCALEPVLR